MGARTATTALFEASSARFAAVLSIAQPPRWKPMIIVTTAPTAAPWTRRLNEWSCKIEDSGMSYPSVNRSKSSGHPDGCRLNEFFEGPPPCVGVSVDHHARLPNECRCKTIAATQSFRVRFKIKVANWTPPAHARPSRRYDLHRNTKDRCSGDVKPPFWCKHSTNPKADA